MKVADVRMKVQKRRLNWYGQVARKHGNYVGRKVMEMDVPRHRRRGRPKYRWKDKQTVDMLENNLLEHKSSIFNMQ